MKRLMIIDMTHACDVVRCSLEEITPPLLNRMGTGGNQVPLILKVKDDSEVHMGKSAGQCVAD